MLIIILIIVMIGFSFKCKGDKSIPSNVVIVYIDDMGFGDLGRTGAIGYETPNFDEMAANGIFFSNYYCPQAVCTASRARLLMGCHPNRLHTSGAINHTDKVGINDEEETIAELLKSGGYVTAAYCKWHIVFYQ